MSTTTYEKERTKKQVEIDEVVLERVKRGLQWLEETHGPGWEDKIDMKTLDLSSGSHCVLGQVFDEEAIEHLGYGEGFWWASNEYALGEGRDADLGFDLGYHVNQEIRDEEDAYFELQAAWEHVLTPRMSKRGG